MSDRQHPDINVPPDVATAVPQAAEPVTEPVVPGGLPEEMQEELPEDPGRFWAGHRIFGIRIMALVEITLLLGLILAADSLWYVGDRFASVAPHPFWIVVLLIAVQYGTIEGLVAVGICSVALLAGNLPPKTLGADYFDWQMAVAARPIMWTTAAVVLGELVNRHRRRGATLAAELAETELERDGYRQSLQNLQRVHEKLELALASDLHAELALQRNASRLYGATIESVIDGARDLLAAALKPSQFSIYLMQQGQLTLAYAEGWDTPTQYQTQFEPGEALFDRIASQGEDLRINRREDQVILADQGVLAGVLVVPGKGHVLGMLKIERLPYSNLSYAALANFHSICELTAAAFDNVGRLQAGDSAQHAAQAVAAPDASQSSPPATAPPAEALPVPHQPTDAPEQISVSTQEPGTEPASEPVPEAVSPPAPASQAGFVAWGDGADQRALEEA